MAELIARPCPVVDIIRANIEETAPECQRDACIQLLQKHRVRRSEAKQRERRSTMRVKVSVHK